MKKNKHEGVTKIVVSSEDELLDVISKIRKADSARMLLTFSGDSNLLISPINFKVLQKIADEEEKALVVQIFDHKAGVTNAKFSGVMTLDSPQEIKEDLWESAKEEMFLRNREKKKDLRKSNIGPLTEKRSVEGSIEQGTSDLSDFSEEEMSQFDRKEVVQPKEESELQKKIDEAMSRIQKASKQQSNVIQEDGFVMSVGGDVAEVQPGSVKSSDVVDGSTIQSPTDKSQQVQHEDKAVESSLIGHDLYTPGKTEKREFNDKIQNVKGKSGKAINNIKNKVGGILGRFKKSTTPTLDMMSGSESKRNTESNSRLPGKFGVPGQSLTPGPSGGFRDKSSIKSKFKMPNIFKLKGKGGKKFLLFAGIGFLLVTGIIVFFMYNILSRVVIEIFIESKPVSVEREFVGQDQDEFSLEENRLSVIKREVPRDAERSVDTTGTGYRGKEASGIVTLKCFKDGESLELAKGTTLTSDDGKKFNTLSQVTILCPNFTTVSLEAAQVGSEYNIQSGSFFTVEGQESSDVNAVNNTAFTGGYKEDYPTVAEEDINETVDGLKETVFAEVKEEMKDWGESNGWIFIEDTLNQKVEGDPESDFNIGDETDIVQVSIKTKSTGFYYKRNEIEEHVDELLEQKAREDNVFEGIEGVEDLKDTDYSIEVKVEEEKVIATLKAKGLAKPEVNKEEITDKLQTMKWEEGLEYIKNLEFTVKEPEVEFTPEWFPKFMWNFPDSDRRIVIKDIEVEATPEVDNEEESGNADEEE